MRRAFTSSITAVCLLLIVFGCGSSADLNKPETQKEFGVRMAKLNLWREAEFRFRRAVEINPNDAMARNNLAVALEANGNFDAAAKEYREALRLDRTNQHIQRNYSRFVEFTTRAKKGAGAVKTAETTDTTATTTRGPQRPVTTTDIPTETTSTDDMTTTNPPIDGGSR